MKEKDLDHSLVARYVAGELHDEEFEYFEKELLKREDYAQAVWEATLILRGRSVNRLFDVERGLNQLNTSIYQLQEDKRNRISWSPFLHRWIKFAAVFVLTLLGFGLYFSFKSTPKKSEQAASHTIFSTGHERKRIILPDSSIVQLNFHSSISFEKVSFDQKRILYLSGEAYFEVKKDKHHPFEVHTLTGILSVLGTRFTLTSKAQVPFAAEVFQGTVEVRPSATPEQGIRLTAGKAIKWNAEGQISFYNTTQEVPEWVSGTLHFDHLPMKEVFQRLESYYGIQVLVLADELLEKRITGVYKQAPLELVLKQIGRIYPFDYSLNKEQLTIKPIQK